MLAKTLSRSLYASRLAFWCSIPSMIPWLRWIQSSTLTRLAHRSSLTTFLPSLWSSTYHKESMFRKSGSRLNCVPSPVRRCMKSRMACSRSSIALSAAAPKGMSWSFCALRRGGRKLDLGARWRMRNSLWTLLKRPLSTVTRAT